MKKQERINLLTLGSFCSVFSFCKVLNTDRHIEFKAYGSLSNMDTSLAEEMETTEKGVLFRTDKYTNQTLLHNQTALCINCSTFYIATPCNRITMSTFQPNLWTTMLISRTDKFSALKKFGNSKKILLVHGVFTLCLITPQQPKGQWPDKNIYSTQSIYTTTYKV